MFDRLTGYNPNSFSRQHENLLGLNVNSTELEQFVPHISSNNAQERWRPTFKIGWYGFRVGANKSKKFEPDSM